MDGGNEKVNDVQSSSSSWIKVKDQRSHQVPSSEKEEEEKRAKDKGMQISMSDVSDSRL